MALGSVMPAPKFYAADANGHPLTGGKLWTYVAGLPGTMQQTFSDAQLTVPNTNPVILDCSGRATVFLPPGSSYKFVLQDNMGGQVWEQDNVGPAPAVQYAVSSINVSAETAVNNFNLGTDQGLVYLRVGGSAPVTFTGVAGGFGGRVLIISNVGTSTVKLLTQSTNSAVGNRFICPSTQGQIVGVGGTMMCFYDAMDNAWRLQAIEPGRPIPYTPVWQNGDGTRPGPPVIGNGQIRGWFSQRGNTVTVRYYVQMGTTTTYGDPIAGWGLTMPFNVGASGPFYYFGSSYAFDSNVGTWSGLSLAYVPTNFIGAYSTSGATSVGGAWQATTPMAWGANDAWSGDIVIWID